MQAIGQAAEAVVITDEEGIIQYVNPAFEKTTGYSSLEAFGENPSILKSGQQDEEFYRDMWQIISNGRTWKGRFVNKCKNGNFYTEEATISPVLDSTGKIVNYVAVKRDITEQLKTEAQLQQAQKMESVGRLAGGVAHDFNNMLHVILGYTDMALKKTDPETALYNNLTESRKAANRASDLTRQLLAFARKQVITPIVLDLNETVSGMLMMLRRLIGENIELIWQPTATDTTVKMDPSQIDQILANLCVNARDAIKGVGNVKVKTGTLTADAETCAINTELSPGEYVTISVSDDGCGIDSETIKHIFEPFYTTKGIGEGTGLGLATVYGILKQNNGCINLTSVPVKGDNLHTISAPGTSVNPCNYPHPVRQQKSSVATKPY